MEGEAAGGNKSAATLTPPAWSTAPWGPVASQPTLPSASEQGFQERFPLCRRETDGNPGNFKNLQKSSNHYFL